MDKQKFVKVIQEEGRRLAKETIIVGLILCSIHLLGCYQLLLSEGELIREELVGGVVWNAFLAVDYFIASLLLRVFVMSSKK